jgi:hypothetical protein
VDFYSATVGNPENIMLTDIPTEMAAFVDDIDRQGRDYYQFFDDCRTSAFVYGHTYILVDQPAPTEPIRTAADEQRAGLRPYCVEIEPDDMLDWELDATGRPKLILYRVEAADGEDEYRLLTTTEWAAYRKVEKEYVKVSEGIHSLGRVPVVPLFHKRDHPFVGCSGLNNAARYAHKATIWLSQLDQSIERQMFSQMWVRCKAKPSELGVGTDFALHLNPTENEEVGYVAPPTAPLEFVWEMVQRLAQQCNWAMGLGKATAVSDSGGGADKQSGIAKQWDLFRALSIMKRMARHEQDLFDQLQPFDGGRRYRHPHQGPGGPASDAGNPGDQEAGHRKDLDQHVAGGPGGDRPGAGERHDGRLAGRRGRHGRGGGGPMTIRPNGVYWVRDHRSGEWTIAKWNDAMCWWVLAWVLPDDPAYPDGCCGDARFSEIGPPITTPAV